MVSNAIAGALLPCMFTLTINFFCFLFLFVTLYTLHLRLRLDYFGLDKAADLIYDKAEECCPEKWGGGGCPEEEI